MGWELGFLVVFPQNFIQFSFENTQEAKRCSRNQAASFYAVTEVKIGFLKSAH